MQAAFVELWTIQLGWQAGTLRESDRQPGKHVGSAFLPSPEFGAQQCVRAGTDTLPASGWGWSMRGAQGGCGASRASAGLRGGERPRKRSDARHQYAERRVGKARGRQEGPVPRRQGRRGGGGGPRLALREWPGAASTSRVPWAQGGTTRASGPTASGSFTYRPSPGAAIRWITLVLRLAWGKGRLLTSAGRPGSPRPRWSGHGPAGPHSLHSGEKGAAHIALSETRRCSLTPCFHNPTSCWSRRPEAPQAGWGGSGGRPPGAPACVHGGAVGVPGAVRGPGGGDGHSPWLSCRAPSGARCPQNCGSRSLSGCLGWKEVDRSGTSHPTAWR